jgi:hypothetical protein
MFNATPFLPGLAPRRLHQVHRCTQRSLAPLQALWGPLLDGLLSAAKAPDGINSRERLWPLPLTFWTFLSQVLCPGSSCREAVRRAAAWLRAATGQVLSENDSAYCQARGRLPTKLLFNIWHHVCHRLEQQSTARWCAREVFIVDGAECQTPDTAANQKRWPQPSSQKPGCGFPHIRFLALFSLATGALLRIKIASRAISEQRLLAKLWGTLRPGAVLLADRHFCGYAQLAMIRQRGLHFAFRLQAVRPHDMRQGRRLDKNDRLIQWTKPLLCPKSITPAQFAVLPPTLELRLMRFAVSIPGFRTRAVYLVTSLLDPQLYPLEQLAELYRWRWQIELCFRHVKITLQMQYLRCKSPQMVIKELLMHCISYNLARHLMLSAAETFHVPAARLSFKGTLDTLRHWACALCAVDEKPRKKKNFLAQMLYAIATDPVPDRPNRVEPRAVKRRPKHYPPLTKPRSQMKTIPHAHRVYAQKAKLRRNLS